MSIRHRDPIPFAIATLALLSYGRIWFLRDGIWDDNTWLTSIYATGSLQEFLATGFVELRRELLGTFFYYFLSLHKTTDYFYPLLHSINLLSQILSPLCLYYLVKNLFPEQAVLAVLTGLWWVAFPLDHTLPYISAMNYRLGMTLTLVSLLCTERAVSRDGWRPIPLTAALGAAALAQYVFLEPTITMEPGRAAVMWLAISRRSPSATVSSRGLFSRIWPFALLTLPTIIYKLLYKPFGMYEGIYPVDLLFFLHPKQMWQSFQAIFAFERRELGLAFRLENIWAFLSGIAAMLLAFMLFKHLADVSAQDEPSSPQGRSSRLTRVTQLWHTTVRTPLLLATSFLIPPASLFFYAHLPFVGEQHNTHAALLQIGSALLAGTGITLAYHLILTKKNAAAVSLGLALIMGTGVAFNNKYLDLYFHSWQEQSAFLKQFVSRFPSLPAQAIFFFDVQNRAYFSDLRNPVDFEFPINLLFATSRAPGEFRQYLASTPEEYRSLRTPEAPGGPPDGTFLTRRTHWGTERLEPAQLIVVRYRDGRLLVNEEILEQNPDVEYAAEIPRTFPALPSEGHYVLREKVPELAAER